LENKKWFSNYYASSMSMSLARYAAAAATFQNDKILVTGGWTNLGSLNSVEIFEEFYAWKTTNPYLPVTFSEHCLVALSSTTVMAISGRQNGQHSGKTFYFTVGDVKWTEGPELKNKRSYQSCGRIRKDKESQEMSVIVAGGHDGLSYLSSVEILDEGSNEWRSGPELPLDVRLSQMVEDQNGGVILVGGQLESMAYLDTLYQLPHGGQDAVWTKMVQKLKTGRYLLTAFLVPENIVDCP
jgi:hypothetical protein